MASAPAAAQTAAAAAFVAAVAAETAADAAGATPSASSTARPAASAAAASSAAASAAAASARRARHADYGQCWGEGAARCFSIEGDFLDEDQGVRLMPVPDSFVCPISLSIMVDPVAAVDGTVYERDYIERWIRQQRQDRKAINSPVTGLELHSTTLMPLAALQRAIETYLACRPELRQVPTEGRSFEEAAQVLQGDLIEKSLRQETTQEEMRRLREKNEELTTAFRTLQEAHAVLMAELEHASAELKQMRDGVWRGRRAYVARVAAHRWTLPAVIVGVTFASYVVSQLTGNLSQRESMPEPSSSFSSSSSALVKEFQATLDGCLSCSQLSPLGNTTGVQKSETNAAQAKSEGKSEGRARDAAQIDLAAWSDEDVARRRDKAVSSSSLSDLPMSRQIELLRDGSSDDKRNVVFSLWNMAVGNAQIQVAIARAGAIAPLVGLLQDVESEVKEAAAAVLGSLAEHAQYRASIAKAGAIPPLIKLLEDDRAGTRVVVARSLWGLTTGNPGNQATIARAGAIPLLVRLLSDNVARVRVAAGAALCGLAIDHPNNQVAIAKAGAIDKLVKMLMEDEAGARVTAAAALRNLAISNVDNQAEVVRAGAIKPLVDLLWDDKAAAQEDAAYMLANLAANNANHRTWIGRAGAIEPLIKLLGSKVPDLQEAASMVLRNLAGANSDNAVQIVKAGAIAPLVKLVGVGAPRVRKQAAWALWNLGTATSDNLAAIVHARAVAPIVKELGDSPAAREEIHATLLKLAAEFRDDNG